MIRAQTTLDVARTKADVFAYLDDVTHAPLWLTMCVRLEQTSPPPRRVGSTLLYTFKQGGQVQQMAGAVTGYEPGRLMTMAFADTSFRVGIEYRLETAGAATRFTHVVEIEPLGLAMKMLTPVISASTQSQLEKDTARLGELLGGAR